MGVNTIKSTKGCTSDGKMSGDRNVHTTGKGLQIELPVKIIIVASLLQTDKKTREKPLAVRNVQVLRIWTEVLSLLMHSRGCVTTSTDLKSTWMCFSLATSMIATIMYFSAVIQTLFSHYIPFHGYECWYCDWGHLNSTFSTCIACHWCPTYVCRAPATHEDSWPNTGDLHYAHTVPCYVA